jgi:hypothetical protein
MHLDFYWIYEIPGWLFGLLLVALFIGYGVVGLFPSRRLVRGLHKERSYNDIVGFYLSAVTVLYGITLGLVAVGTWTTHAEVETRVSQEAEILGSLYRDVHIYPEPLHTVLRQDLRDYTQHLIEVSWPQQRQGIISNASNDLLDKFQHDLASFEPATPREQIIHAEAYKKFNQLSEMRRARIDSVRAGLPCSLWVVVILGALITIGATWFFEIPSMQMHFWMTLVLAGLLGLMIYVVAALDNPFRGEEGVTPDPLIMVLSQTMQE